MTISVPSEVTAPSPRAVQSAGHHGLTAMTFVIALIASGVLLGRWQPFPPVPVVREKIEHLARCGDDYDVLFIGSSRVYFQAMPAIFDQIAREQGVPIHSFNAAVGAMLPPEDGYFLEQVLRRPHKRLRWVFLEIMPLSSAKGVDFLAGTGRAAYWHDFERTRLLTVRTIQDCQALLNDPNRHEVPWPQMARDLGGQLGIWLGNLGLCVECYSNHGRGSAWLLNRLGVPGEWKEHASDQDKTWDGWAYPTIAKAFTKNRRDNYARAHESLLATQQRFEPGDALSWEVLRAKIDLLREEKVTPIMMIPPTVDATRYLPPQLAERSLTVLDFSDPREYPELFTPEHRLDGKHLNYDGAEIFTKELALKFLETVKKSGQAP